MYNNDEDEREVPFQTPMSQFGTSVLQLTNPDKDLLKMEMTFRAQAQDSDGNIVQLGNPLMNDEGISSVIGQVQAIVNQVTVMSNIDEKNIPILIDFIGDTLAKDMMVNRIRYHITNPAARDKIYFSALATSFVCLRRALNNGERSFLKGSQQDIRQYIDSGHKSEGFFSKILGWGQKK